MGQRRQQVAWRRSAVKPAVLTPRVARRSRSSYLSSDRRDMGAALVECSGGCSCVPTKLDGHRPKVRASVQIRSRLRVDPAPLSGWTPCWLSLRINVLKSPDGSYRLDEKRMGHHFKLTRLIVEQVEPPPPEPPPLEFRNRSRLDA